MEYKIITSYDDACLSNATDRLEKEVEKFIKDGWKPLGGIAITQSKSNFIEVAQAMIKE